jgi:hypothetical protein
MEIESPCKPRGLLCETAGKSWGKVYVAPGVLAALEQRATT